MLNEFQNRDGWWNKYIKNTGPVEYKTLHCRPHWQCIKCDFNDEDIENVSEWYSSIIVEIKLPE